ncbi:MAG: Fe-S cluster assembly protein SufB [Tissierellia bacterium]|nr:Fe-S cluster assembly protein SufB [Tissierellia bacterium]
MENKRKKTYVEDLDRGIYDRKDEVKYRSKIKGLNEEVIRMISEEKNEPEWMLDIRLKALKIFNETPNPVWGPDLSEVDIDDIITYIRPDADLSDTWESVPDYIRDTFDALGIQEAEKELFLSGVGAQYDSEVVYHNLQQSLIDQGVIYTDFETGLKEYEDIVKKHYAKAISPSLHKYAALHYALSSGGSFIYVPKGVRVDIPLQSYYRLNAPGAGQFEHTLIVVEDDAYCHFIEGCSAPRWNQTNVHAGGVELYVGKNSTLRFSSIENWSRNMYNLNTKRAIVEENGSIQWVGGSFGSKVSMLYPTSVLIGEGAKAEMVTISFGSRGQVIDNGASTIHAASNTSSNIITKSISKGGGEANFRGMVKVLEEAKNCKSTVSCESLMLDNESRSDTIPYIEVKNKSCDLGHEAKIGRIDDQVIYYLMTRGFSEEEAKSIVVRGFAEPIAKELPMEYAVEMNNLINLELEGTIG